MNRKQFRALSRDLFCDLVCDECSHSTTLTGYADDYFFDAVNKVPSESHCAGCGKAYNVQWFRDGVEMEAKS